MLNFLKTFSGFCIKIYHLICLKGFITIAHVLVELYHNHHSAEVHFITSGSTGFVIHFLVAFTKLWQATISFIMSVHLSAWNSLARLPLDGFSWNLILLSIFQKFVKKI